VRRGHGLAGGRSSGAAGPGGGAASGLNLVLNLAASRVVGTITATLATHFVDTITSANCTATEIALGGSYTGASSSPWPEAAPAQVTPRLRHRHGTAALLLRPIGRRFPANRYRRSVHRGATSRSSA
jgi:hypothetical protein